MDGPADLDGVAVLRAARWRGGIARAVLVLGLLGVGTRFVVYPESGAMLERRRSSRGPSRGREPSASAQGMAVSVS